MINFKCLHCKKIFQDYKSSNRSFCSKTCAYQNLKEKMVGNTRGFVKGRHPWNKGKKFPQFSGKNHPRWNRVEEVCKQCKKKFEIEAWRLKEKSRGQFCSLACSQKYRVGDKAGNWKGGKTISKCKFCESKTESWPHRVRKYCKNCRYKDPEVYKRIVKSGSWYKHPVGEKHQNWKGGKESWPSCLDCGKHPISYYAKWCKSCSLKNRPSEVIRGILTRRYMSKLEERVNDIIIKHDLPYRFVGNGEFFIERKVPDFISTNEEKIAIEVYARRHKEKFRKNGLKGWKKERKEVFNNHGWKVIFIEEWQTNNEKDILKAINQE